MDFFLTNDNDNLPELPSAEIEARAFWRMRGHLVMTMLWQTFQGARFRLISVLLLSGFLWGALLWLCIDGFLFIRDTIPDTSFYFKTVQILFGTFFMALTMMLVFSTGIILYSSLFRGPDIPMLLTLPTRASRLFLHKFQAAVLMSSWVFLLLGSPMLLAYGVVSNVPWYYYAMLIPFLVAFTYVPASLGAILCLLIVRFFPDRKTLVPVLVGMLILLIAGLLGWSITLGIASNLLTYEWLQEVLGRLQITQHRLLPSWWLSQGLLDTADSRASDGVMFLVLLISNALFFRLVAMTTAEKIYRSAYSRLFDQQMSGWRIRTLWTDWLVRNIWAELFRSFWIDLSRTRLGELIPLRIRILIVKDFRLFVRDPVQWSQFMIFFVLLLCYFINIRQFDYGRNDVGWVNLISFLNVSVVGLLLSTFTTRFIFPMISLEGRRFWILGLLPLRRDTILWSKFIFAAGGSIIPCSLLILLSDIMLRVDPWILASHQLTCLILCFGLSGIAVGLGAKYPSFREESPSRIAAGFGGTLNLVLSTLFIIVVVLLTAVPSHFYVDAKSSSVSQAVATQLGIQPWIEFWLIAGSVGSVMLGIFATVIPLRIGFHVFQQIEF